MWKGLIRDIAGMGGFPISTLITLIFLFINTTVFFQLLISFAIAYGLTIIGRTILFKERPKKKKHKNIFEKIDAGSFPSLHSARAAVLAVILSIAVSNNKITILFVLSALGVAWARVKLYKHYPVDVIAGLIIGILSAGITVLYIL